jgi:hypothetical protein
LKIRGIVDDACPVRDLAQLTLGQVIEALVANRLTSPAPLVHIQSWAREWAVGEALGVEPELLNDRFRVARRTPTSAASGLKDHRLGALICSRVLWTVGGGQVVLEFGVPELVDRSNGVE